MTFAEPGRCVVGVDPSATMLDFAAHRAGADAVRWILGNSGSIPQGRYDLMVMSGNVAQHIPEGQWIRSLKDLRRVAASDALLAFESRNPQDRAWGRWAGELKKIRNTQYGEIEEWCEVEELGEGQVRLRVKKSVSEDRRSRSPRVCAELSRRKAGDRRPSRGRIRGAQCVGRLGPK